MGRDARTLSRTDLLFTGRSDYRPRRRDSPAGRHGRRTVGGCRRPDQNPAARKGLASRRIKGERMRRDISPLGHRRDDAEQGSAGRDSKNGRWRRRQLPILPHLTLNFAAAKSDKPVARLPGKATNGTRRAASAIAAMSWRRGRCTRRSGSRFNRKWVSAGVGVENLGPISAAFRPKRFRAGCAKRSRIVRSRTLKRNGGGSSPYMDWHGRLRAKRKFVEG